VTSAKAARVLSRRLVYVEERLKLAADSDNTLGWLARERDALYVALRALDAVVPARTVQSFRGAASKAARVEKTACSCHRCPVHGAAGKAAE
jgi:hypothetical protein